MLRFAAIVVSALVFFGVNNVHATKVNGKIVVTGKYREKLAGEKDEKLEKLKGYWSDPNGVKQVEPPRVSPSKDLGVVIFKEGATAPKPDEVTTVKVRTGSLDKNVVVVRPGSRLKFRSVDPYDHELYSTEHGDFKPEKQSRNAFRPIDFTKEGVFEVRCKAMPHFSGWVVVVPATYVLDVKSNGEFVLEDMEPGKYEIKIFHNGKWVHSQAFEIVKEREIQVEVKLDAADKDKKAEDKKPESEPEKTEDTKKDKAK